jgi:aminoglycoside phosphotransferase (APT) family kinase protein
VVAVFDWEMSTIGDPLADLGWLLSYWIEAGDSTGRRGIASTVTAEPGFLKRREMIDRYEARSGRRMTSFQFYEAFAIFKLAIIMEGSYARYLRGQTDDPLFIALKERVPDLADAAWAACSR